MWKSSPSSLASSSYLASMGARANIDKYRVRDKQVRDSKGSSSWRRSIDPRTGQLLVELGAKASARGSCVRTGTSSRSWGQHQQHQQEQNGDLRLVDLLQQSDVAEEVMSLEDVVEDALCVVLQFLDAVDLLTVRLSSRYLRATVDTHCQRCFSEFFGQVWREMNGESGGGTIAAKELVLLATKVSFVWQQRDAFLWAVSRGHCGFLKKVLCFDGENLVGRGQHVMYGGFAEHLQEEQEDFNLAQGNPHPVFTPVLDLHDENAPAAADEGATVALSRPPLKITNVILPPHICPDDRKKLKNLVMDGRADFSSARLRAATDLHTIAERPGSLMQIAPVLLLMCRGTAPALHADRLLTVPFERKIGSCGSGTEVASLVLESLREAQTELGVEYPKLSVARVWRTSPAASSRPSTLGGPSSTAACSAFPLREATMAERAVVGRVTTAATSAAAITDGNLVSNCVYLAASYRQPASLRLLLDAARAHFRLLFSDDAGDHDHPAHHSGVAEEEVTRRAKLLLALYVNMASTFRLRTPLFAAAKIGAPEICELLLAAKANPMQKVRANDLCALEACVQYNSSSSWCGGGGGGGAGGRQRAGSVVSCDPEQEPIATTTLDAGGATVGGLRKGPAGAGATVARPKSGGPEASRSERVATLRLLAESLPEAERTNAVSRRVLMQVCARGDLPMLRVLVDCKVGLLLDEARRGPAEQVEQVQGAGLGGFLEDFRAHYERAADAEWRNAAWNRENGIRGGFEGENIINGGGAAAAGTGPAGGGQEGQRDVAKTPLLAAVMNDQGKAAEYLLEHAARETMMELDVPLASGKTALYLACERGQTRLVKQLLRAGASLDTQTCHGKTPLHAAVEKSHEGITAILCENAVDVRHITKRTKGEHGVSPFMLAEKRGKASLILPMLRAYHRQVRKRHLLRQCGDDVGDVTHPYLTQKLLEFKSALFDADSKWNVHNDLPLEKAAAVVVEPQVEEREPQLGAGATSNKTHAVAGGLVLRGRTSSGGVALAADEGAASSGGGRGPRGLVRDGAAGVLSSTFISSSSSSSWSCSSSSSCPQRSGATSPRQLADSSGSATTPAHHAEVQPSKRRPQSALPRFGYGGIQVRGSASRKPPRSVKGGSFTREATNRLPAEDSYAGALAASCAAPSIGGPGSGTGLGRTTPVSSPRATLGSGGAVVPANSAYHNANLSPPTPPGVEKFVEDDEYGLACALADMGGSGGGSPDIAASIGAKPTSATTSDSMYDSD